MSGGTHLTLDERERLAALARITHQA
jgi:hypothetical protein